MRIAMWSGPRNLSTAMMYAFGNRSDFSAMDEPFYAAFLAHTGEDHPMRSEILASQTQNLPEIDAQCRGPGSPHLYMKHMAHHMLEGFPFGWAEGCLHVHLIRHPARVVASYAAKREAPSLLDIGFQQQVEIFDRVGGLVIDSTEVRADPEKALRALCRAIDLPFDPAMLSWHAGPRIEDGVWAKHWYGAVHASTGFAGKEGKLHLLEPDLACLADQAQPYFDTLYARRLRF